MINRLDGKRKDVDVAHDFHYAGGGYYGEKETVKYRLGNISQYYASLCKALNTDEEANVKKHYVSQNIVIDYSTTDITDDEIYNKYKNGETTIAEISYSKFSAKDHVKSVS